MQILLFYSYMEKQLHPVKSQLLNDVLDEAAIAEKTQAFISHASFDSVEE